MGLQGDETPQKSVTDDDMSTVISGFPFKARIEFAVPVSNDWPIHKGPFFQLVFQTTDANKSVFGGMCCVFFLCTKHFFQCIRHDGPVGPPGIFSSKCCDAWIKVARG